MHRRAGVHRRPCVCVKPCCCSCWHFSVTLSHMMSTGVLGCYYFTMALMNHNAAHCHDVRARNKSQDWGQ